MLAYLRQFFAILAASCITPACQLLLLSSMQHALHLAYRVHAVAIFHPTLNGCPRAPLPSYAQPPLPLSM